MSTTAQLRAWALCLAELGWHVFPLRPHTKRWPALHGHAHCPATGICRDEHQGWEQRATTDPDRIQRCWTEAPYNIGLVTGPSGLVVLDLDQPKSGQELPESWNRWGIHSGAEVLDRLADQAGEPLPDTYTVTTPSGGSHLYFRAPAGIAFRNTGKKLGPLIDTRAGGGYVVAPGSTLPEGAYELDDDTEPAELPGWLVQALTPEPSVELSGSLHSGAETAPARRSSYVAAALRGEEERIAAAEPDQQNNTLYTAALALGRLVAGGAVDTETVRTVLHRAMAQLPNTRPNDPWTPAAIDATIRSAFRTAAGKPRHLTPNIERGEAAA